MKTTTYLNIISGSFFAIKILLVMLAFTAMQNAIAATYYVSPQGNHISPYTNWFYAATNIQTAVDVCSDGDTVLVSNGVYNTGQSVTPGFQQSNRVVIAKNIILRSINGPDNTFIVGKKGGFTDHIRCVYMEKGVIEGFTITNGHTGSLGNDRFDRSGAGLWITNGCVVSNCIVIANTAYDLGGGIFCYYGGEVNGSMIIGNKGIGGGVHCFYGGNINNCTIKNNHGMNQGGGVKMYNGGKLYNCKVYNNSVSQVGGGVYTFNNAEINGCTIVGNIATQFYGGGVYCYNSFVVDSTIISNNAPSGGGAFIAGGGKINKSTLANNTAIYGGGVFCNNLSTKNEIDGCIITGNNAELGGGVYSNQRGTLTNCLIINSNHAKYGGGVYLSGGGVLNSCTISSNTAEYSGGGIVCSNGGTVINSILYFNTALNSGDNWYVYDTGISFAYCCTTPLSGLPDGIGCISDNPVFELPGVDYHLQESSPCINAGTNMAWMIGATDIDGDPRIQGGTVDIGCYESVPEPLGIWIIGLLFVCSKFSGQNNLKKNQ